MRISSRINAFSLKYVLEVYKGSPRSTESNLGSIQSLPGDNKHLPKKNLNFFGLQISCVEYTQVYSGLMVVYNSSAWSTNDIFQATKNLPRICSICTHSEYYDNIE